ncbi:MAG: hypothetical protein P4L40_01500 [Terracidiphilus sp.]|nr:hypothetical protein [Terracidiphilus sp.]
MCARFVGLCALCQAQLLYAVMCCAVYVRAFVCVCVCVCVCTRVR